MRNHIEQALAHAADALGSFQDAATIRVSMRRFWLVLLAFVLPLQMTWAAMHLCDGQAFHDSVQSVQSAAERQEVSAQDEAATSLKSAEELADSCASGHGCHGLHNVAFAPSPDLLELTGPTALVAYEQRLAQHPVPHRHERPQWSAA
jgi:hypothetical protein